MASEFQKTFFIKPLNFCQHIFLAHIQLQIKFEIRILACQSRFSECELFQKNLLIFNIAAKRRKKHKNQILGLVSSMCYNEQKSNFKLFTNTSSVLSIEFHKYSNVKLEEWILIKKKNIRQDLQDYLDRRAFGLRLSRRRRKKSQ